MAPSGTYLRIVCRACCTSQGGKARASRRTRGARRWLRPRTTTCVPGSCRRGSVALPVMVLTVADQRAGPVRGAGPDGVRLAGPGLDVGREADAPGTILVAAPGGPLGAG